MVVWVTGLSGSGKTSVCRLLFDALKPKMPDLVLLDGDALRDTLSTDLGFEEADRIRQIGRVQQLAKLLSEQDLVVLVAVVYARPDLLEWNRHHIQDYFEVLLDAPLDVVRARDPKGLYARITRGEMVNVVGVDLPWHQPKHPDIVLDPVRHRTPEDGAAAIARAVPCFAAHWSNRDVHA